MNYWDMINNSVIDGWNIINNTQVLDRGMDGHAIYFGQL